MRAVSLIATAMVLAWATEPAAAETHRGQARFPCKPEGAYPQAVPGETVEACSPPQPEQIPDAAPIITIDDTRTHGPVARDWLNASVDGTFFISPITVSGSQLVERNVVGLTPQLSLGVPGADQVNLDDLLKPYDLYELRVRGEIFWQDGNAVGGPLSVAVQHYFPIQHLNFLSFGSAHLGIETAFSTPWLSGRTVIPPVPVRVLEGVDTELAESGWSLRPVAAYLRGDFLACRSLYGEIGGAPEVFVPGIGPTEYDVRFHAAGGWSFTCPSRVLDYRPKVSLEYRGRVGLPTSDQAIRYDESIDVALQVDLAWLTVQAFAGVDPRHADYQMYGIRVQAGYPKDKSN
jgi:hypothetical protein